MTPHQGGREVAERVAAPGPGGQVTVQLARPDERPAPAVLVLAPDEAGGRLCDRFAAAGFFAAAPSEAAWGESADVAATAVGVLLGQQGVAGTAVGVVAFPSTAEQGLALAAHMTAVVTCVVLHGRPPEAQSPVPVLALVGERLGRGQALGGAARLNVRLFPGVPVEDVEAVAAGGDTFAEVWEATVTFLRRNAPGG